LHAFLAAGSDERNLLAFFQALEAIALDSFEVYEQIVTGLRGDEAEAFFIVEPLNGASLTIRHGVSPKTNLITALEKPRPRLSATSKRSRGDDWIEILHQVAIHGDTCSTVGTPYVIFQASANLSARLL
jgi:hypothetical protein